ncbi:probable serine/threonine-protein kinase DDB_G0282963 [Aricia agestis]|uniref:probable serine/threonine-protein kinase DDB_G0282963 n=1 Tax=Aricia agestis TaxID=91739 RepID=UPI001C209E8E|nr:probable serine/threonine-protein kinase DDB_G0282963 [Aricia agestis]
MGFSYKYIKFFFVLLQSSSIVNGLNIDCHGKAFHCVNVTHFRICVDLGGGISKTVDDFLLPCPDNTFCMPANRYECEYHETTTTTTSTTTIKSDFSEISELRKVSVIPLLAAEKKSETTTAAVKETTEKSSTLSILKNIEDTSSKPASENMKDEKLTSETFFDFYPTESYLASAEQNFDTNNINKEIENHFENTTKDFKIINKTEYSSPKSDSSNRISDKNVTLDIIMTDDSVNNIENNNYTIKIDQEKNMPSDNKTILKIFVNIPYDKLKHTLNNNNLSDKSMIDSETGGKNVNHATLNLSNGIEKNEEHRVKESSSLNPTLSIRNISFVEKTKNHENTTEDFHKIDKYFIKKNEDASQMRKATSGQNVNIASLVSNSTGSEKDEDERVLTNSVQPNSLFLETSIKDDKVGEKDILTEINTSSVVHVVLNKTSDKNKEGEKNVLIPNSLLTTNSSLAVRDDYIDAKFNISGSETLDSRSVPVYEEIKGKDITNVIVTISPTNNKNNYLQVVTDVSTNGEQLLDNFMSTSAYPDVIVIMRNYTFDEKNETTVTSNTVIHKQSKEIVSKQSNPGEERSTSVTNITSFVDDHYLNSSLSLNLESPVETMIPTDVSQLSDKLKTEISNVSKFTNSNNFSVSLNDKKTEITENVFTTKESSNRNENKTNYSENKKIFNGDAPINSNVLNGTIQETEANSPKTNTESLNENDPKLLREANTLSILELQTTTEDSGVVKATTNNINELDFRDDQHKTVIETETVKYTAKNETIHNPADLTANQINKTINSNIIPNSINNFMSLSEFENNLTTVPENEVIKRGFDNEKNSDDNPSSRTSSSSNSNLLHEIQTTRIYETITTSTASVLNINNDEDPHKKNTASFLFATEPSTENYYTYSPDSPVIHTTTKRHVEAKEKDTDLYVYDSITAVTSSIVHNSSLLTATEKYDSSKIALEDLSLTDLRLVMNRNINGSRWLRLNENIPSAAVKNDTIAFNNSVVYTHNIQNTYNTSDDSSLFVATTDSYVISTITSNSYTTKSEIKIGQPKVTNTYFTEEKFVASTSKKSETQISPPSVYNLQERIDTKAINSVLKTSSIEPYETTTQIEQIYFTEIEADSNRVSSNIQFDKISNNTAYPNKIFTVDFNTTSSDGASSKRGLIEFDQLKIMKNATEMDKDFPLNRYPIHLLSLSKSNDSDSSLLLHDDNLDPTTETMKSGANLTHNARPDNVSDKNDLTNNTLINATEKYQTIIFTSYSNTHHTDTNNTKVSDTITSIINSINQSVPIQLEITTKSSKESKLKQHLNTTEFSHSTLPITLTRVERINFTDDKNIQGTKSNTTVNSYNNILDKDLPLNISKNNDTIDVLLPTQDYISSFISTPKTPLIRNISLVSQSKGDIISTEPINTNILLNINNLTTSSSILDKLVSDFYAINLETNTEDKLTNINSQNNIDIMSNTPLNLQITNGTLRPLLKTTLGEKTKKSSNTLNTLKSTAVYDHTTRAYNPEVELNNNNNSNTALIDTISGNNENLDTKLTGKGLKDLLNITQSIKIDTGNTRTQYLLAQVTLPAIILPNNLQNSKVQNVTKTNSLNASDTIVIRQNDALNLLKIKVLPTQYFRAPINNDTKNKPITYPEHENISQGKEIKTNVPIPQFVSNFNKSPTKFIDVNVNSTLINNLRKPTSLLSIMSSFNKSSTNTSILDTAKTTTNNDTDLNSIPVKNIPVTYLLGDKSSFFNQTKSYNQTHTVTALPKNNADGMKANKCLNQPKGKYADKDDCKKFYLCLGDAMPVLGECPNGTVFSESKKQCTKNLSQCYRNNRFICLSPGRYYDLSVKNVYYICVKNRERFIQFKYQCQNGYSLNETIVKCIKDSDSSAQNNSDSNTKEDSASISVESSSKAVETLKIKSSKKADTEFECKKEGKYPHPKKCNQYILCTKIKKSVFHRKVKSCDSGEVFDKEKKQCVDSDSHECL